MKVNSCKLIFGLLFVMMACSQNDKGPKPVSESFDRIVYLNSLDMAARGLYTYTLGWVYFMSNDGTKASLRNTFLLEIPRLKEQRKLLTFNAKDAAELDQVFIQIDSLTSMVKGNIVNLQTFEDYVDENGEESENLKGVKSNIETKITPAFLDIEQKVSALLAAEEKTITSIFASSKDIDEAKKAYTALSNRFEFQRLNLKLFMGVINWVYRPTDVQSKESLTKNLKTQIPLDDGNTSNERILKSASAMHDQIVGITESLAAEAYYEDPTVMFMSENTLESEINPMFLRAQFNLNESIKTEVEWIALLLVGKTDVSKEDLSAFNKLRSDLGQAFSEGDLETITSYHHPNVVKALAPGKLLVGRDTTIADLRATFDHYTINFKENKIESFEIHGETATEITSFTIEGVPRADSKPFTFKGRTMVVYVRYNRSPTGWAIIREMIQAQ